MKNIKYIIVLALFSILLACNKNAGCLSPYNDCNCKDGYEGDNCKTRNTEKFLGNYLREFGSLTDTTALITVVDSVTQLKRIYIKKFSYYASNRERQFSGDFYGNIDGEHITVPVQEPSGIHNFKRIQGEICLANDISGEGLIMKLKFESDSIQTYRIVYLKK